VPGFLDYVSSKGGVVGFTRSLAREARALLDGHEGRRGIHAPALDFTIKARDPRVRALAADRFLRSLEFGAEIGGSHMVIHSPFNYLGANPFVPPRFGIDKDIALVHATLERVLPAAEQAGCTIVIENTHDTNPALLLALVRSFDSEHVRMSLDTGHAFVTHCMGGPPPDQWVREAGSLLGHLHLQDTDSLIDRHWLPGMGQVNWFALLEALGELQHLPRLVIETVDSDLQSLKRAIAWLEDQWWVRRFLGAHEDVVRPVRGERLVGHVDGASPAQISNAGELRERAADYDGHRSGVGEKL
jgi:sugar phosphate isomerase/epimerase